MRTIDSRVLVIALELCAGLACGGQVAGEPTTRSASLPSANAPRPSAVVAPVDASAPRVEPEPPAAEVAPPEPPPPLPQGEHVTVAELVAALELVAKHLEGSEAVKADYDAWVSQHELAPTDRLWRDYVRVRLVFECVRDGGLWQLRWAITNREPNSDEVWAQWKTLDAFDPEREVATATAECDELSALFAHLVRRMGVKDVGLFWPVWNHVVAVWTLEGEGGPVRVVVPTSQIFLDRGATLGTKGFNPWKQKKIYEYRRRDVRDDVELPGALARFFIARAWSDAGRSLADLQADRNARSDRLGGS